MKNRTNMNMKNERIPESLSAAAGDTDGEINLLWEPVKGAKYYVIQSANGSRDWKEIDIINKTIYTASQLRSGKQYRFRVAAVSSEGQGPWSEPAGKKAP
jgi:hypothetical protein